MVRDLASARAVAVLPVGAIEAHGPHLPLATDVIIADGMAREGAERLSKNGFDVVLLPALPFTAAPCAAAFPGTIDVPAGTMTAVVISIAQGLARHGVTTTAIANAHFDPAGISALRAAEAELAAGRDVRLVFPDVTRRRLAERLTEEFRSGACHAGRYETSIVLAERPDLVHREVMRDLPPNPVSLVDANRQGRRTFEAAGGRLAYFGSPAEATAEEGLAIVAELGAILADAVLEVMGSG